MDLWNNHIVPIMGFPEGLYTDNGSRFSGDEVQACFSSYGVRHILAPISYPQSPDWQKE